MADGSWHHVAMVVGTADSARTGLFIDGQLICRVDDPALDDAEHLSRSLLMGGGAQGCPSVEDELVAGAALNGHLGPLRLSTGARYSDPFVPETALTNDEDTVFLSNHLFPVRDQRVIDQSRSRAANTLLGAERVLEGPACGACGDGLKQADESCDDGNRDEGDECTNVCDVARCGDGIVRLGVETCDDGNDNGGDGCENDCTRTPAVWDSPFVHNQPSARFDPMMAYDPNGEAILLFGGDNGQQVLDDMWNWNGFDWVQLPAQQTPPARRGGVMVTDVANGNIVLFGGRDTANNTVLDDTWTWDGIRWTQHQVAGPAGRSLAAATSSAGLGGVLIAGGQDQAAQSLADVWLWNGERWTQRANLPTPRSVANMGVEGANGRVILVGGQHENDCCHAGTLAYDIAGDSWTQLENVGPPLSTQGSAMASDGVRNELVRFAGSVQGGDSIDETWFWAGDVWRQDAIQNPPSPRSRLGMTFDPERGNILIFGGLDREGTPLRQTWIRY